MIQNYISLVHEISFINLKYLFLLLRPRKSGRHDAEDRSFQLHETCYISIKKMLEFVRIGTIEDIYGYIDPGQHWLG